MIPSILGPHSVSRQLSADIVAKLRQTKPGIEVRYRDLAADPVPPLSGAYLAAQQPGAPPPSADIRQDIALGAALLDEFLGADIVVIGAPMYNFTISTQLKTWIDRLLIAGKTFRYSESGVEGLAGGKRLIIASSRGGIIPTARPRRSSNIMRNICAASSVSSASRTSRSSAPKESPLDQSKSRRGQVGAGRNLKSRQRCVNIRPAPRRPETGGRRYFASTSTSLSTVNSTLKLVW